MGDGPVLLLAIVAALIVGKILLRTTMPEADRVQRRIVLLVLVVASVTAVGLHSSSEASKKAAAAAKLTRESTARQDRQNKADLRTQKITSHGQCLRLNDGRNLFQHALNDNMATIFTAHVPGTPNRTAEQQAFVAADLLRIQDHNAVLLHKVDCDVAAPMPPNPTKAELADLPKPTPIPPYTP